MMGVVIGGSAGALDALRHLFAALPPQPKVAFAVVIHIPPRGPSLLAEVLASFTAMPVREAVDKLPLTPGTVVVATPDYHLLIERDHTVSLSRDAAIHFSRPAIDPLFETAAEAFRAQLIGVLLTGANEDGASGVRAIRAAGGRVAIQEPATAASPQMPTAGLAMCSPDLIAAPDAIGTWLGTVLPGRSR